MSDIKSENLPEVEMNRNPPQWQFVEKLLAPKTVPTPLAKTEYPSGWRPPNPQPGLKYFVPRTKNFMLPVYLHTTHRGMRRISKVRKVEGELKYRIEKTVGKEVASRINEMSGQIAFHGDYVTIIQNFLYEKGL